MATWTVDVEYNFGGRTNGTDGLFEGIDRILQSFDSFGVRGVFFISTEVLQDRPQLIRILKEKNHAIGSHGHFHTRFKEKWRRIEDRRISEEILGSKLYRAPKFYWAREDNIYSSPRNHTSLLKHMWVGEPVRDIIYLHPFDIVETEEKAPNLFCKLWYSQPKRAYETFISLLSSNK